MSKSIIKVENLSKRYRIGSIEKKADTFAQQLGNALYYPINNFRQIRNLGKFKENSSLRGVKEEGVHWALKDVSFDVKQGEILGIIGKNGAGKSTLLKILSRITEPSSGRVEINGRIAALLEVGTGFHPELTGRENIYMNGTILGMTKREIDRKLDEIIDFSGIGKFVDTPIKFYSSGMKVRLGFSVAAHLDPEILVVDEVLAVGDYEFQQKCLGKMEEVSNGEGRTILFVSHNLAMVRNLCNKGVFLENGELSFSGDIHQTLDNYLSTGMGDDMLVFCPNIFPEKQLYLEKLEFLDFPRTGGSFEVQLMIFNKEKDKPVEIALSFTSLENLPLLQFYSGHMGQVFNLKTGTNKIINKIDDFPLINGVYYLNIWIGSKGQVFDFIPKAIKIEIRNGNIIEDGPNVTYNGYPVIKTSNWIFEN